MTDMTRRRLIRDKGRGRSKERIGEEEEEPEIKEENKRIDLYSLKC